MRWRARRPRARHWRGRHPPARGGCPNPARAACGRRKRHRVRCSACQGIRTPNRTSVARRQSAPDDARPAPARPGRPSSHPRRSCVVVFRSAAQMRPLLRAGREAPPRAPNPRRCRPRPPAHSHRRAAGRAGHAARSGVARLRGPASNRGCRAAACRSSSPVAPAAMERQQHAFHRQPAMDGAPAVAMPLPTHSNPPRSPAYQRVIPCPQRIDRRPPRFEG